MNKMENKYKSAVKVMKEINKNRNMQEKINKQSLYTIPWNSKENNFEMVSKNG